MYPEKKIAQLVIAACSQFGIDTVVISPGSRNAPLTVGFYNHPTINTYSVVDERVAAFFALGIAQQKQKPVAVLCTSGSALLNYYPAISEAFYSKIPLVVISADRPKHLIDIGDGQTIRQENVFVNHIGYTANLVDEEAQLEANTEKISEALRAAISKKEPVHINVPFDEPLYETVEVLTSFKFPMVQKPVMNTHKTKDAVLCSLWNNAEKKLILIGENYPSADLQEVVLELVKDPTVLIMTETTSNIHHPLIINSIDKLITPLSEDEFTALQPDILVTLGGMVVSKRIKQFLRKYTPKQHWHIDELRSLDTYFCLSEYIKESPSTFFKRFLLQVIKKSQGSYQQKWIAVKQERHIQHQKFFKAIPYSDLQVFGEVLKSIPNRYQLQLSNSSVIRYSQLFDVNSTLRVFCNRGTSGIDGSTSTAIGAALVSNTPTVLVTGDISFYYDSNALWNHYISNDFRVIIINNSGGGIFKIIPGPSSTNALPYFETPHALTAVHLAKMHNFEYAAVHNLAELITEVTTFYEVSDRPRILEVFTPADVNDDILKKYFKSL